MSRKFNNRLKSLVPPEPLVNISSPLAIRMATTYIRYVFFSTDKRYALFHKISFRVTNFSGLEIYINQNYEIKVETHIRGALILPFIPNAPRSFCSALSSFAF